VLTGRGIHFLSEQTDHVASVAKILEQRMRLIDPARPGERLNQPKRAREERPFAAFEPIAPRRVPVQEWASSG
jgi:hypothetical protein